MAKYRCFLTMILKLRMFCSHLLVTQDIVKKLLTDDIMLQLRALSNAKTNPDHPTSQIVRWLEGVRKKVAIPKAPQAIQPEWSSQSESQEAQPSPIPQELQGDRTKLVQEFHKFMLKLHEDGQWVERYERTNCPRCSTFPIQAVITSCKHMYCDECFCALTNEASEGGRPVCQNCTTPIEAAAYCGSVDDIQIDVPTPEPAPQKGKQPKKRSLPKKKYPPTGRFGLFASVRRRNARQSGSQEDENDGEVKDWIPELAMEMPGSKLSKVRELVAGWIQENPEVKVVIFTQFLDFVRILSAMCRKAEWKHVSFTGKMPVSTREQNL
ncbi:helicase [Aspergillus sclerotialis]|uniref:Helicase n=1 Tax=Aspergillus sclerotialis TaxID=2070753 RepID=A0A3A3A3M4_9EURO|nr:helicase [Aspergillus sclerotialis]